IGCLLASTVDAQCGSHSERAIICFCFFFSSRRRHTRLVSDWSSDVCSSDLRGGRRAGMAAFAAALELYLRREGPAAEAADALVRSEERRVGKEWRSRWSADH